MSQPIRDVRAIAHDIHTLETHLRLDCDDPQCRTELDALFAELDAVRAAEIAKPIAVSEPGVQTPTVTFVTVEAAPADPRAELAELYPDMSETARATLPHIGDELAAALVRITRAYEAGDAAAVYWVRRLATTGGDAAGPADEPPVLWDGFDRDGWESTR